MADDGRLYTFSEFLDQYREGIATAKWDKASDDTHLAADGGAGGAGGLAAGGVWRGRGDGPDEREPAPLETPNW